LITTELQDAQGTFTLTPAPSNTFDPLIDAVVVVAAGQGESSTTKMETPLQSGTPGTSPFQGAVIKDLAGVGSGANVADVGSREENANLLSSDQAAGAHVSIPEHVEPFSGGAFLAGSASSFIGQSPANGIASCQLVDLLFQASLPRFSNPLTATLLGTVKDGIEHIFVALSLCASWTEEGLDLPCWNQYASDLIWQRATDRSERGSVVGGKLTGSAVDTDQCQRAVPSTGADHACMEQYFEQVTDDATQDAVG
jgi:hypothetical protein